MGGRLWVRTIWIVDHGHDRPRFVTGYPATGTGVIRELEAVVLTRAIPVHGLKKGDVGAAGGERARGQGADLTTQGGGHKFR
jgi:hypothetical protein